MLTPIARQRGATLIDVLVGLLLLSLGLTSTAALHVRLLAHMQSAQQRAAATQLALDLSERLRANALAATQGVYDAALLEALAPAPGPGADSACAAGALCSGAEIAARDLRAWHEAAQRALPAPGLVLQARATVPAAVDIWVTWRPAGIGPFADPSLRGECPPAQHDDPQLQCLALRGAL